MPFARRSNLQTRTIYHEARVAAKQLIEIPRLSSSHLFRVLSVVVAVSGSAAYGALLWSYCWFIFIFKRKGEGRAGKVSS